MFKTAQKFQSKLRLAIDGPAGSGKTYTALRFAFALGNRIAVIDTEHGSASKYAGESPDGIVWDFDVCELTRFSPSDYTSAILEAGRSGYEVLVIDSLSHAWTGEGGALEMADRQQGNKFTVWKTITPIHNRMVETILRSPCHVIVTMRSKTEYVIETDDRGKQIPRKVGLAPVQRPGIEFEFDLYGGMDWNHVLTLSKSRCPAIVDAIADKPGSGFLYPVIGWLQSGTAQPPQLLDISPESELQPVSTRKQLLIDRIKELWQQQLNLGHQLPEDESKLVLEELSEDELCNKGKLISSRVKKLESQPAGNGMRC